MPESSHDQTPSDPIVIIGAGLAGLACAHHLAAADRPVIVLEASDRPGGRVRTETVTTEAGTHRIDRGFQVYLTAYPEGRRLLDLDALDLREFASGAMVHHDNAFHRLADPLRDPRAGLKQVLKPGPVMKLTDIAGVGLMDVALRFADPDNAWDQPEETSLAFLRRKGLSEQIIERFFRPFFGGVFLDRSLETSARKLQFTYAMFAKGAAALPARGMVEIPAQLAAALSDAGVAIRTNTPADRIETTPLAVRTKANAGTASLPASAVVLATDASAAATLAKASGITGLRDPLWKRTITLTFEADPITLDREPATDPILFLNGDGVDDANPVNHAAIISNISPAYAPPGKAQVCANIVAPADMDRPEADLARAAQSQLARWFGPQANSWTHIHTDDIRHALPGEDAPALSMPQRPVTTDTPGVYLTGDHLENASINGALLAGRRTAETILAATV